MKLREGLAVSTLIVVSTFMALVYFSTNWWRYWQADRALSAGIEETIAGSGRAGCEALAPTFGGGAMQPIPPMALLLFPYNPRPQIFAYDASFRSTNPRAPDFPWDLKATLLDGGERTYGTFYMSSDAGRQLAVRMPWADGSCAILLGRFAGFGIPVQTQLFRAGLVLLIVVGSGMLAASPIIRRIERLTKAVRVSADSMHAIVVPTTTWFNEIGELERAFNGAAEQLRLHVATIEAREETLRSVVSNTTHDVALPLTVVQLHLSALHAVLPPESPAQEGLRNAIVETHYLAALLHNLGVAARLDNPMPTLDRHVLDLNALVKRVVARHRPLSKTLEVELGVSVPDRPLQVSADVTLLEQAASNLVHNAVRYNKPGGHVAVILGRVEGTERFSLRVIDDGPGIPAEERAHLTTRTFRGSVGRAQRPEGQGLGLHIVREVVERHSLDLSLRDSDYGGAEFEIQGECLTAQAVD